MEKADYRSRASGLFGGSSDGRGLDA
jgi:ribosome-binding factor A